MVHLAPTDSVSAMTPYTFIRDKCTLPTFAEQTWDWSTRIRRLRIRLMATVTELKEAIAAISGFDDVKVSHHYSLSNKMLITFPLACVPRW